MEKANALSVTIGKLIALSNSTDLKASQRGSKDLWTKVNQIRGKSKLNPVSNDFTAEMLNSHYAKTSTDLNYVAPTHRKVSDLIEPCTDEIQVFYLLDRGRATAAGMDGLPQWFLRLAAPCIALPVSYLFNISITHSFIPSNWKTSIITPVPKVPTPSSCSDFRPISVTPILSRLLEKLIVRKYLYPVLSDPITSHKFDDQFAFRPTGSTTAALINLFQKISELLQIYPYVHVISLDFSKAFDTVRHSTFVDTLAELPMPAQVHNWIVNYLSNRGHCTRYKGEVSAAANIDASIVQGSVIGPMAFVINNSALKAIHDGNLVPKYADDTCLVAPSVNTHTIQSELDHISSWAGERNLTLNIKKKRLRSFSTDKGEAMGGWILRLCCPVLPELRRWSCWGSGSLANSLLICTSIKF